MVTTIRPVSNIGDGAVSVPRPGLAVVTGAAGFIGSTLCEALLAAGWCVRGIDAFTSNYEPAQKCANLVRLRDHRDFELIKADLASDELAGLFDSADVVAHLAGEPGVSTSWGAGFACYVRRNVLATQRLLDSGRDHRHPAPGVRVQFVRLRFEPQRAGPRDDHSPSRQPLRRDQAGGRASGRGVRRPWPARSFAALLLGLRPPATARHGPAPLHRGGTGSATAHRLRGWNPGAGLHLRRRRRGCHHGRAERRPRPGHRPQRGRRVAGDGH